VVALADFSTRDDVTTGMAINEKREGGRFYASHNKLYPLVIEA